MYSYPIHCRNQRTAAQVRTPRPSPSAIRQRIARDLRVADLIARAIADNASQLYRGA